MHPSDGSLEPAKSLILGGLTAARLRLQTVVSLRPRASNAGLAANHLRRRGPGVRANIRAPRDIWSEHRSRTAADGREGRARSTPRVVMPTMPSA